MDNESYLRRQTVIYHAKNSLSLRGNFPDILNTVHDIISTFFWEMFLPQGFPHSVSRDYLRYQLWDTIQAFASSLTGSLATLAVLKGVGVGNESASALAGAIAWIFKDGLGMIGRIYFGWARGSFLDSNCKQWRLAADFLNDAGFFVDLIAPHFSVSMFAIFACFSSLLRSIVGVAGGATRMAITQHQALLDNTADVATKDGSQETLVNLVALLTSLLLLPQVDGNPVLIWLLYILFTSIHLFANYRAVRSLQLNTLNQSRFNISVRRFLSKNESISVEECNLDEPLFLNKTVRRNFGCKLCSIPNSLLAYIFATSAKTETSLPNFGLYYHNPAWSCIFSTKNKRGWIILSNGASDGDKFDAVFFLEHYALSGRWPSKVELINFRSAMKRMGWILDVHHLNFDEYRFCLK